MELRDKCMRFIVLLCLWVPIIGIRAQSVYTCSETAFAIYGYQADICQDLEEMYGFTSSGIPFTCPDNSTLTLQSQTYSWAVTNGYSTGPSNMSDYYVYWNGNCQDIGVISLTVVALYTNDDNSESYTVTYTCEKDIVLANITSVNITQPQDINIVECYDQTPINLYASGNCVASANWTVFNYPYDGSVNTGWTINYPNISSPDFIPDALSPVVIGAQGVTCQGNADGPIQFYTILRECPPYKVYSVPNSISTPLQMHTSVQNYISVQPPSGYVTVYSGNMVLFKAGQKIVLNPGFEAAYGSVFRGKIQACNTCDAYRPLAQKELTNASGSLNVSVRPNPFTESVEVMVNEGNPGCCHVTMYDISGKKVYEETNKEKSMHIPTSNLRMGVYFISVVKNGMEYHSKIIKTDD
jgi:hypothetical protein